MSSSAAAAEAGGGTYWLRWQVLVCAAILYAPAVAAAVLLPRLRKAAQPLRAADLWVPCWARLHPAWLLGYRAFALAASAALLLRVVAAHGAHLLFFYTQWTFALVTIYFAFVPWEKGMFYEQFICALTTSFFALPFLMCLLIPVKPITGEDVTAKFATAISACGCWDYSKRSSRKNEESHEFLGADAENRNPSMPISGTSKRDDMDMTNSYYEQITNDKRAGFWGNCMQVIYQTSAGAAMLTDVTFWCLLVPFFYRDKFGLAMVTDGMHSLNAVFLLIDTVLNKQPFPWYRIAYFAFWSCSYVTFQWVLHSCCVSWWPYPFLELSTPWAPLWYLGMAITHVPCFFLYWFIVEAKRTYFPRLFPDAYASAH